MKKLSVLLFMLSPLLVALSAEEVKIQDILYTLNDNVTATVSRGNSIEGQVYDGNVALVIPGNITHLGTTYRVVGVDDSAFYDVQRITSVTLGANVTTIGKAAFAKCPFAEIIIPKNITSIKDSAFVDCSTLTNIYLEWLSPLNKQNFGVNIFAGIAPNAKVHIPGCTDLAYLENNTNTDRKWQGVAIDFPEHTVTIKSSNSKVGTVTMIYPSEGSAASYISTSFQFGINDSIEVVASAIDGKFERWEDENGEEIENPSDTLKIKLTNCNPVFIAVFSSEHFPWREATINDLKINLYASGDTAKITSGNSDYSNANLVIPEKVSFQDKQYTVIGIDSDAFKNNKHIVSITLSDKIISIGDSAFANSAIDSISIPSTITRIESGTFRGCTLLQHIYLRGNASEMLIGDNRGYESASSSNTLSYLTACQVHIDRELRNIYEDTWGGIRLAPIEYYVSGKDNMDLHGGLVLGYGLYAYKTTIPMSVIQVDYGWHVTRWEDNKGDVFIGADIGFPLFFAEDIQIWPVLERDTFNFVAESTENGGTIEGTPMGRYPYEESISISASDQPDANIYFHYWRDASGNKLSTNKTFSFSLTRDTVIWAVFGSVGTATLLPLSASVHYHSGTLYLPGLADGKVSVYAISGRRITYFTVPASEVIPLALPSGIYLLELLDNHFPQRLKLFIP